LSIPLKNIIDKNNNFIRELDSEFSDIFRRKLLNSYEKSSISIKKKRQSISNPKQKPVKLSSSYCLKSSSKRNDRDCQINDLIGSQSSRNKSNYSEKYSRILEIFEKEKIKNLTLSNRIASSIVLTTDINSRPSPHTQKNIIKINFKGEEKMKDNYNEISEKIRRKLNISDNNNNTNNSINYQNISSNST